MNPSRRKITKAIAVALAFTGSRHNIGHADSEINYYYFLGESPFYDIRDNFEASNSSHLSSAIDAPLDEINVFASEFTNREFLLIYDVVGRWNFIDTTFAYAEPLSAKNDNVMLATVGSGMQDSPWAEIAAIEKSDVNLVAAANFGESTNAYLKSEIESMLQVDGVVSVGLANEPTHIGRKFNQSFVALEVPDIDSVDKIEIPEIKDRPPSVSNDVIVIGDIFFETLGISLGTESLILTLLNSDNRINEQMDELLAKITSKEWEDIAPVAERIFQILVAGKIWGKFSGQMRKKVSARLALRCVPVVGWIYCIAALIVCVKKNYNRFSFA